MRPDRLVALWMVALAQVGPSAVAESPLVGEVEKTYALATENRDIRGLAFDEISPEAPRLFVLDGSGKVFVYRLAPAAADGAEVLGLDRVLPLPCAADRSTPLGPRGLAFSIEDGRDVLCYLSWSRGPDGVVSMFWRWRTERNEATAIDISRYPLRIGDREVLDLAHEKGRIWISFDPSGYSDRDLRVQRGIILLRWNPQGGGALDFVKHLPDAGTEPSRALACMELEGAAYLWGTVGDDFIYAADAASGRGLFHFARPRSPGSGKPAGGLCFGRGALWVPQHGSGAALVQRVNVTRNLDARVEGQRALRHLVMTIETEPETKAEDAGKVFHYYSRPCSYDQIHCQGTWLESEKVTDASGAPNAAIQSIHHDPAGDVSSRQHLSLVEYHCVPARACSSRYEMDLWTNSCRKFVYPHRVNRNREALEGTSYLEDDPVLYNLKDGKAYNDFFKRVRAHIEEKYDVAADLDNPYWAARNVLEYIQDRYYYPSRPSGVPATVDYHRAHYDANPGNLKIELSAREYDRTQIIACSGTSVMLAGAMRYLGIPARWLGTATEQGPRKWDSNGNGILDRGESAQCTNGHRYNQVWLGSHYGWICFDATPSKPELNDYDPPPPLQPQWRYMNRAAAGHMVERRIVFNIGSKLLEPLYRDFEYDERLAIDNDCGGDQRYNLQGRFEQPRLWKLAKHRIELGNSCFIEDVALCRSGETTSVTWRLEGRWDRDPEATVSIHLQQLEGSDGRPGDLALIANAIPARLARAAVDLSGHRGKRFRIVIRKDGDLETGGQSESLELE